MAVDPLIHPTSIVSSDAALGSGVRVGPYVVIHPNVSVDDGGFVDSHSILGAPATGFYDDPTGYERAPCRVGRGAVIRSHTVVYAGVTIGDDFGCGHRVTIREGVHIAEGVRLGTACDVQPDAIVGRYARLHSNVFVASRSRIDELTWLFPYVVLLDDPHPPSDTCTHGPTVRRFASVGAGSTIFPGVEIGEGALVGAMSVVRRDVPPDAVVAGVPASVVGTTADVVCREGRLESVYPWWRHFRRGYPEGVLPDPNEGA